jgi:hypothetical protein
MALPSQIGDAGHTGSRLSRRHQLIISKQAHGPALGRDDSGEVVAFSRTQNGLIGK